MANFGRLVLTNLGLQEQAKAQGGASLKFKRIGMGSGKYSGNISALTRLVNENVSVAISNGRAKDTTYTIEGFFANDALQTGFEWREIGVFVEDQNGNEILYCYANAGDTYDYIPATADERYSKYIRVAIAIGNATNVSVVESEGILYVDTLTFKALADEVDSIHPSKKKSGSVIVFDDSANLPFVGMKLHGKSEQVKTKGNQLANMLESDAVTISGITWSCSGGIVKAKGTSTAISSSGMDNIAAVITGLSGTFYINGDTENVKVLASVKRSDGSSAWFHNQSLTLDGTEISVTVYCQVESGVTVDTTVYPMLNAGSSPLSWEPYTGGAPSPSPEYPQEILSIENPTVSVYGKNILEPSGTKTANGITLTLGADGIYTISGTTTGYININIGNAFIKGGYKYKPTVVVYSGSINPSYWSYEEQKNMDKDGNGYLSSNVDTRMSTFLYNDVAGVTYDARFAVMLELVTDAETGIYEPYREAQSLTINAPNGLLGIPVSSGGNYTDSNGQQWICDEVDLERDVYIQRVATKVFNGTEATWRLHDTLKTFMVDWKGVDGGWEKNHALSSHFISDTKAYSNELGYFAFDQKGLGYFATGHETLDEFKAWIGNNPVTVVCKLITPIETALTDEEIAAYKALRSNNPTTTIFNDAGAEITAECITASHDGAFSIYEKRTAECEAAIQQLMPILTNIAEEEVF